jgi:two-component system, LytTR family, response regulator
MEQIITCIIIDDEPLGQELIEKYIGRIPSLKLLGKLDNAIEALDLVDRLRPSLIFLDVNLPEMSGIEFIRTFNAYKPQIILTTAYSEHAVEGFEYDVTDFILKPVTFDRFVRGINKAKERLNTLSNFKIASSGGGDKDTDTETARPKPVAAEQGGDHPVRLENRQLLVKENKKFINISIDDIHLVEGMKDYLKIHVKGKMIITHMTMGRMEEMLPASDFLRVNRSFIVRKSAVKTISGNIIELLNNLEVPIGIKYRDVIKELMDKGSL